jgi:hypothetical protein
MTNKQKMIYGGLGVVAGLVILSRFDGFAGNFARGAVKTAAEAAGGVVHGFSDLIGLPVPSRTECDKAKAEGDKWGASFACPATEYLRYLTGR